MSRKYGMEPGVDEESCKRAPFWTRRCPAIRPVLQVAGITGYDRLRAAIPVRDVCGMEEGRLSFAPSQATKVVSVHLPAGGWAGRDRRDGGETRGFIVFE